MYMKKNVRGNLLLVLCGALIWLLTDAEQVRRSASEALSLCAGTVVPALFPFMVVSGLLMALGFGDWLSPRLAGLMGPLFHLPGSAGSALLLGFIGGYPIGVRTAAELYRQGSLTREEASRLLTFCNNSNPAFLISVLGVGVFGNIRTGMYLWLIHLLSALLTGMFFRDHGTSVAPRGTIKSFSCRTVSLPSAFVGSVSNALTAILSVCAFVVVFYVVVSPLKTLGGPLGTILVGSVELFSLTPLLTADRFGFLLAACCSGWGGLSVLAQTAAVLDSTDLPLAPCLQGKSLQALLSLALALPVHLWLL